MLVPRGSFCLCFCLRESTVKAQGARIGSPRSEAVWLWKVKFWCPLLILLSSPPSLPPSIFSPSLPLAGLMHPEYAHACPTMKCHTRTLFLKGVLLSSPSNPLGSIHSSRARWSPGAGAALINLSFLQRALCLPHRHAWDTGQAQNRAWRATRGSPMCTCPRR